MDWIAVVWLASIGACLVLALMHLLVWCRDWRSLANLCFPLIALGIVGLGASEIALMRTSSPSEFLEIVRLGHLIFGITVAASLLFVHFSFGTGRNWLLFAALALRAAAVVANYTTGGSLHFRSIEELGVIRFLGEWVHVVVAAEENPWVRLGQIAAAFQIAYVTDASVRLWRRRGAGDRHHALWIGGSTVLLFLIAMILVGLISSKAIRAPILVSFPFFGMVLAISYDMSRNLQRSARLAADLEASERRLALAGSAGQLAFWEWDLKRDRIWLSPDGWPLIGLEARDLLSFTDFLANVHEDDRPRLKDQVERGIEPVEGFEAEFRVRNGGSSFRWLSALGRIEVSQAGEATVFRGCLTDITARKEAENDAEKQRRELAHLSRVSTLGALSGVLAHELNQPLAAILSNAQTGCRLIGSQALDLSELREILNDIVDDTKRAGAIIHSMRGMFSKDAPPELVPIDLNLVVGESLSLLNGEIVARKGKVDFAQTHPTPLVMGRFVDLQQVVVNLMLNGLDACSSGLGEQEGGGAPRLWIRIVRTTGAVILEVADNGPGIDPEARGRLFEPFFSTKSSKGGLGLGLSISRDIVERLGGTLELSPLSGSGGAIFQIWLPLIEEK